MTVEEARDIVLGMVQAEEYQHFGKTAYRIAPKKTGAKPGRTFMTLWIDEGYAVLMLDQEKQADLIAHDPGTFRPHPGKWGLQGCTIAPLSALAPKRSIAAVKVAYDHARRSR